MATTIRNAHIKNTQIGPTIVTRGLISCWNVASTYSYPRIGSTLYDLIKVNRNHGDMINMNSGNFNDEVMGNLVLDGTNEYINIPYDASNPSLDVGAGPFSIAVWVAPTELASSAKAEIVRKKSSEYWGMGASAGWSIGLQSQGTAGWRLANIGVQDDESSYVRCDLCGPDTYIWDEWHYITMSYSSINKIVLVYVDMELVTELSIPPFFGSLSNTRPFEIGGRDDYSILQDPFKGSISSLSFYNTALSYEEMLQNYNSTKARFI